MYHLESAINRLFNIRNTIFHISQDAEILKDVDLPNYFGDFALDTIYPEVEMDNLYRSDINNYDVQFYSFPPEMYANLKIFIQNYADFNNESENYYYHRDYWKKLKKLKSWKNLKKSADELLPLFDEYLLKLGITRPR